AVQQVQLDHGDRVTGRLAEIESGKVKSSFYDSPKFIAGDCVCQHLGAACEGTGWGQQLTQQVFLRLM
ncbi:hypothetical protein ACPC2J_35385, partial [Pseudomonas aeruginosa]|uniref:hypothetical protein n=1 Tax=Pseudomonas aeruginosa TaxID=287 RepID=UPI00376FD01F